MKREFLMLAQDFEPNKHSVTGWWASEKLDGQRAFWDGGITRGLLKRDVPWANCDKDSRYVRVQYATGLWSRYGHPYQAPDWFLDQLPPYPLDGELWISRGIEARQQLSSIIKKQDPNSSDWSFVDYHIFGAPKYSDIFFDSTIKNTNYKKQFKGILEWLNKRLLESNRRTCINERSMTFREQYDCLKDKKFGSNVKLLAQHQIPYSGSEAKVFIEEMARRVIGEGGEGLILRAPDRLYVPERVNFILKMKGLRDAEATVVGYTSGRRTDLGSRHLGRMGALIVKFGIVEFELSGFTDDEREFEGSDAKEWATLNPGARCPTWVSNPSFPIGTVITFQYRDVSRDGVPQEARYWRKRID